MIYENQQTHKNLSIRTIILASMMFQALMSIITKFDLKMIQMNVVNAFVNYQLDEMIYMK